MAFSTCTLGDIFEYVLRKPINTGGVQSLVPGTEVAGTQVYNCIVGQAPDPSVTGTFLDLLLTAFVPGNTVDSILGTPNDTIVGLRSRLR